MVVLGVEVDPEEVGQPSSTLRTRQEHVRERTSVRRGPTWAVCRERTFAVRSVRKAIAGRGAHLDMFGRAGSPWRAHQHTCEMCQLTFMGQAHAPRVFQKHPLSQWGRPSLPPISTFRQITPTHQVCRGHLEKVLTVQFSAHHANLEHRGEALQPEEISPRSERT